MAIDASNTPFALLGGEAPVRALTKRFYELMFEREPALTQVHRCDESGRVHPEMQERFALFLIGWLGGPQTYIQTHGHPRLRMRHGHVVVDVALRDAWLRSMSAAMNDQGIVGEVRAFLDTRFAELADFLRNAR